MFSLQGNQGSEDGPRELRASELVVEQQRAAHGQPQHVNHSNHVNHPPNGHLSNGVVMGTKALTNGNLSNGTHGVHLNSNGGTILQNGGPADVHKELNGTSNNHISEGEHLRMQKIRKSISFYLKVGDWNWNQ